jgi:16S rRNA (guanine1516-N2)-methyltransferase
MVASSFGNCGRRNILAPSEPSQVSAVVFALWITPTSRILALDLAFGRFNFDLEFTSVKILASTPADSEKAKALSKVYKFDLVEIPILDEIHLVVNAGKLQLWRVKESGKPEIVEADFLVKRAQAGKKEMIMRACGFEKGYRTVIDGTAGLGSDALFLAQQGFEVLALERSPILFALLSDAWMRAGSDLSLSFRHVEAAEMLTSLEESQKPDVVYLDPMYPEKKKTALSKKEMQFLQEILIEPSAEENLSLFRAAMKAARFRVVVKRPLWAETFVDSEIAKVSYAYEGKSLRFDTYFIS